MSKINIKVGEMYFVRVKVTELMDDKIITRTVSDKGSPLNESHTIFFDDEVLAFTLVNPYPAPIEVFKITEIPEAYPKYDPCRLFREGDEVRYVPCNGRECPAMTCDEYYREKTLTVVKDEDSNHQVLVRTQDGREKYIRFCYLQLITPVEELEPYIVKKYSSFYAVEKRNDLKDRPATYDVDFHPHAKEAAEAECDRLNEEYRKEMEK